ncbi:MAG: RnfABCDGE type electron transport complex subunit C, partial [Clostridia bacterium]|nr:RnfABCDGE type electron transport complex subunit C [Clostridia bacterium]
MLRHLLGTTHVPHLKNTAAMPAVRMPVPKEVLIPMSMHIGAPCTPTVKPGDKVTVGQKIGEAGGYVSSPIHSSVSGTVTKIESLLTSSGRSTVAVRIESDGLMTPCPDLKVPDIHDFDSFNAAVRESGLVGLGGAGFPAAVKFDAEKKGLIKHVVLNGAECEPYITSDTRTMLDHADLLFDGVKLLMQYLSAEDYVIGIEKNKPECIEKLTAVFADEPRVKVIALPDTYPQGGEKILIHNTLGLTVPEGKLPADVGCVVMNVTSLAFLASYAKTGMPLVEKCLTVDGSAIPAPKNVIAPIGTPIADVIAFVGATEDIGKVLYGGPMMGVSVFALTDPVLKNTNAL